MRVLKEPRGGQTSAAGKLRHYKHTPKLPDIQTSAIEGAREVRDLEERTLSAIYRGLPASYETAIAAGLTAPAMFAYSEHRAVFAVLMADAMKYPDRPSLNVVRLALTIGFDLHFDIRSGWAGQWDELAEILERECSTAGLENYARLVVGAARRRAQVRRLWRALADRVANPLGTEKRIGAIRLRGRVVA